MSNENNFNDNNYESDNNGDGFIEDNNLEEDDNNLEEDDNNLEEDDNDNDNNLEEDDEIDNDNDFLEEDDEYEDFNNNTQNLTDFNNNNLINNVIDLEDIDSENFLQKFDKEVKENYISMNHPECFNKNLNEIKILSEIKKENNIIVDNLHKTIPLLTKFEKTKILGIRVKQLNNGGIPFINTSENMIDNYIIACKELEEKKLPFIIERPLPNNTFEYWNIKDLELI